MSSTGSSYSSSSPPSLYAVTQSLLLQTSLGAMVIDLYGADFPALTGQFISLTRSQLFQGAAITAMVPDHAVIFSHEFTLNSLLARFPHLLSSSPLLRSFSASQTHNILSLANNNNSSSDSSLQHALVEECRHGKSRRCAIKRAASSTPYNRHSNAPLLPSGKRTREGEVIAAAAGGDSDCRYRLEFERVSGESATGSLARRGLLFVPSYATAEGGRLDIFGLTLTARTDNVLDGSHIAIGEVREGLDVLERIRREPHEMTKLKSASSSAVPPIISLRYRQWAVPLRLIRVWDCVVLPVLEDVAVWSQANGVVAHGPMSPPSSASSPLLRQTRRTCLGRLGCWAHIASTSIVSKVNQTVCSCFVSLYHSLDVENSNNNNNMAQKSREEEYCFVRLRPEAVDDVVLFPSGRKGSDGADADDHSGPSRRNREITSGQSWRHLFIEPGVQRLIPVRSPPLSAGLLPSDTDDDNDETTTNNMDEKCTSRRQKVVESLEMAMRLLDATATNLSGSNAAEGSSDGGGAAPPSPPSLENVSPCERTLFVCRLNPVTTSEGLAECFQQFGHIESCTVVQDAATGASLRYGFITFSTVQECFTAMQKMNNVLIDDSRILTNFSQSLRRGRV